MTRILGDFRSQPSCHLPLSYFQERDCWVDCREPNALVIDASVNLGWEVHFVTQTHNPVPGMFGNVQGRPIIIHKNVWIASFAVLYNCTIGEGAVIALSTVVRSMVIPPFTMWAGNPAKMIKIFAPEQNKWVNCG